MRLRQIEVFHAVYSTGSVSSAARLLNVSQPSVSKILRHSEDQLGFQLFKRVKGRLIPTDEAHTLSCEVNKINKQIGVLNRTARNLRDDRSDNIRVAVITGLAFEVTPRAIAQLQQRYPHLVFELHTEHYGRLLDSLLEHEIDIGLAFQPPDHPSIGRVHLGNAEFSCVYRDGEFDSVGDRLPVDLLRGRRMVLMRRDGPLGGVLAAELHRLGLDLEPSTIAETCFGAKSLVNYGLGVTIVDEFTADAPGFRQLKAKKLDPAISFSVEGIFVESRPLSNICVEFLNCLGEAFRDARGK